MDGIDRKGFYLVNHNFAENGEEESGFAVGHGRCADVQVSSSQIILALNVDARLEEGVVGASYLAARRLHQQIDGLQSRFVGDVHRQLVQVGLVIAVRGCFVCRIYVRRYKMANQNTIGIPSNLPCPLPCQVAMTTPLMLLFLPRSTIQTGLSTK